MIEDFDQLAPVLTDDELDQVGVTLERLADARSTIALLSAELCGQLALLKEAHKP